LGESDRAPFKKLTTVFKNQFGFMSERPTMDVIFLIRQLMEYDKIPRNIMWWALKRKLVPTKYVTLIKDMYTNVVICVRTCDGGSDTFFIKIGLHQGSALSPYIFTLVMDEITKDIQGDILWCMLFADDVVLIDGSKI
jgi:Reverse transcriptase (RNA-dependent DNA polymerase)